MLEPDHQERARWDRPDRPAIPGLPVEVTTAADVRRRAGDDLLQRPGRVPFHVALICTAGDGHHEVDFTAVSLKPLRVVHIRPGQVHRWCSPGSYQATIVVFSDAAADLPTAHWPVGPRWFDITDTEWNHAQATLQLMGRKLTAERGRERRNRALIGFLQVLIVSLGLDLERESDAGALPRPYVDLMNQIATDPGWSRSVEDRARRLGYSQRTLTRACVLATGRSAKQVIDDRVLIEAQRLLTDPEQTIGGVANTLDFSEPGNFSKFFSRTAGESPAQWRRQTLRSLHPR